jgi:hypothetical protein
MTNTPARKYPAADHATSTEIAIANLYNYAREAIQAAQELPGADLPASFTLTDKLMMSLQTLCDETGSSISLVFDVARDMR